MNLNDFRIKSASNKNQNVQKRKKPSIALGNIMGPPNKPAPRKRETPSSINWGKSTPSILNTSSTTRTTSSKSTEIESKIVIALTEGRGEARCEVGMAVINISRPSLVLCQISDTQNYLNTLTKINIFNPQEILIPKTFVDNYQGSRLLEKIQQQFPGIKYTGVGRNTFNKNRGIERIQELCIPSMNPILLVLQHRYYALAAAAALLTYTQNNLNIYYSHGTIKVEYQESEGYAIIDVSTADRLELVSSTRPAQATKYSSLYGVLNRCVTKVGARKLRSIILQPPCKVNIIEDRLDCVQELIQTPEMLVSIQAILQKITSIEQLLTISTIKPDEAQSCSNRQLNYILMVNTLIDQIEPLKEILKRSKLAFFVEFRKTLENDCFAEIKNKVRNVIHDDAHPASGENGTYQRCFAIKPGVNGLLDLVRKTYSERIDDLSAYVKNLAEKYDMQLKLGNNSSKGFHIVWTMNKNQRRNTKSSDIPREFIQVKRLAGSFTMKTPELMNLSTRIDDIFLDVLKISNVMVYKIIVELKQYVSLFYQLCDDVAHLDVLQSLAEASIVNTRPKFDNYTEVTNARHPLLDYICSSTPVPNSIFSSRDHNVHIITGPSGSGKSIYIRQVLLLQVMAQIGCYVPAEKATFRPADRMFSRIYLEDDMEVGASSFILEMKEIKHIMSTMTENSLIIIDELCRSTCLEEGMALAIAICEKLAWSSAFLYITTHFNLLTKLYDMYCNVKTWQLETDASGDNNNNNVKLTFKYNIMPGVTKIQRYGVYLVRNIWKDELLKIVDETLEKIKKPNQDIQILKMDKKVRLKYDLEAKFKVLKSKGKLTRETVNKHLNDYQNELDKLGVEYDQIVVNQTSSAMARRSYPPRHFMVEDEPEYSTSEQEAPMDSINQAPSSERPYLLTESQNQVIEQQQLYNEVDLLETSERMLTMFTPETSQMSILKSYHPDDSIRVLDQLKETELSETSSYRNISNFLNENSENYNQLIPEVELNMSENSYVGSPNKSISQNSYLGMSQNTCNYLGIPLSDNNYYSTPNPQNLMFTPMSNSSMAIPNNILGNNNFANGLVNYSQYSQNEDESTISEDVQHLKFSLPLQKDQNRTSTPVPRTTKNPFHNLSSTSFCATYTASNCVLEDFRAPDEESIRKDQSYQTKSSTPLVKTYKTPLGIFSSTSSCVSNVMYSGNERLKKQDEESIREDLEICSKIFSNYESFGEEDVSRNENITENGTLQNQELSNDEESVTQESNPTSVKNTQNSNEETSRNYETCEDNFEDKESLYQISDRILDKETQNNNEKKSFNEASGEEHNSKSYRQEYNLNTSNPLNKKKSFIEFNEENSTSILKKNKETKKDESEEYKPKRQYENYIEPNIFVVEGPNDVTHPSPMTESPLRTTSINYDHSSPITKNALKNQVEAMDISEDIFADQEDFSEEMDFEQEENQPAENIEKISSEIINKENIQSQRDPPSLKSKSQHGKENLNDKKKGVDIHIFDKVINVLSSSNSKETNRNKNIELALNSSDGKVQSEQMRNVSSDSSPSYSPKILSSKYEKNIQNSESIIDISSSSNSKRKSEEKQQMHNSLHSSQTNSHFPNSQSIINISSSSSSNKNVGKNKKINSREEIKTGDDYLKENISDENYEKCSTNISEISKRRNLDAATTTNTSSNEEKLEKSLNISELSKKRNLDMAATTNTSSNEDNNVTSPKTTKSLSSNDMRINKTLGVNKWKKTIDPSQSLEESSDNSLKKPKSSSSSLKESDSENTKETGIKKLKKKTNSSESILRKFVPPQRLTNKQILEEFREQDRMLLEISTTNESNSSEFSRYLQQYVNRPSVQQVKNQQQIAVFRKTESGVEVIEPMKKNLKNSAKRRKTDFIKSFSNEKFDVTIFSDQNALPFEEFLHSDEIKYDKFNFPNKSSAEKKFNFNPTGCSKGDYTAGSVSHTFSRKEGTVFGESEFGSAEDVKRFVENFNKRNNPEQEDSMESLVRKAVQEGHTKNTGQDGNHMFQAGGITPEGYYKKNKDEINKIISKYLRPSPPILNWTSTSNITSIQRSSQSTN